jgi:acetoin utilization protein AcuB
MRFQYPVNHLMTEAVLSVDVTSPFSEALRLFAEYPVHHLPVLREQTLVGMLSSADMMKLDGFLPKIGARSREYIDQRFSIETLMQHPVISVQPHQSTEDAARLMVTHAVHALPVVDIQDHLLGIITTTDMMQALLHGASPLEGHVDAVRAMKSIQAKLSADELDVSLEAAREAVLAEQDPNGIARALLYFQQRVATLEEVQCLVRRYATARQDEVDTLVKALKSAGYPEEPEQPEGTEPGAQELRPGLKSTNVA